MRLILTFLLVGFCSLAVPAQQQKLLMDQPDSTKRLLLVDASCGQCKFGMKGDGCKLAVRINGRSYFVEGTEIDDHGDAHAAKGFCNAIRKAQVQGEIKGNKFIATYFKLVDDRPAKKQTKKI